MNCFDIASPLNIDPRAKVGYSLGALVLQIRGSFRGSSRSDVPSTSASLYLLDTAYLVIFQMGLKRYYGEKLQNLSRLSNHLRHTYSHCIYGIEVIEGVAISKQNISAPLNHYSISPKCQLRQERSV